MKPFRGDMSNFLNRMASKGAGLEEIIARAPEESALGQLRALATAIRKRRPQLTASMAFWEASKLRPELLAEAEEEFR